MLFAGQLGAVGVAHGFTVGYVAAPRSAQLDLIVEPHGWGSAPVADIEAVLHSVASVMLSHAPAVSLPVLRIRHAQDLPRHVCTAPAGPMREQIIHLAVQETRWAQFAFQFAHELFHEISNAGYICRAGARDPQRWFEEAVAETASLYALRAMAVQWHQRPPYPNWRDYAPHLLSYARDRMMQPHRQLPPGQNFALWFRQQLPRLVADGWDRQAAELIANQLLPLFEQDPSGWEAVHWLNRQPQPPLVRTYFEDWKKAAPVRHHPFIRRVAVAFGIDVR